VLSRAFSPIADHGREGRMGCSSWTVFCSDALRAAEPPLDSRCLLVLIEPVTGVCGRSYANETYSNIADAGCSFSTEPRELLLEADLDRLD